MVTARVGYGSRWRRTSRRDLWGRSVSAGGARNDDSPGFPKTPTTDPLTHTDWCVRRVPDLRGPPHLTSLLPGVEVGRSGKVMGPHTLDQCATTSRVRLVTTVSTFPGGTEGGVPTAQQTVDPVAVLHPSLRDPSSVVPKEHQVPRTKPPRLPDVQGQRS